MEELLGWAVAAGICYTAYSLVFGSRASSSSSGSRGSRVDQAKVDRVRDMFPHLSNRSIRWELERNGASVERAVERALREGGLPEPPASYFPPDPQDFSSTSGTQTPPTQQQQQQRNGVNGAGTSSASATKLPPPSLIKRLGLNNKLGNDTNADVKGKGKEVERGGSGEGWANSREEREERLRRRKENLVLEARRKLLEKEQKKKQEAESLAQTAASED
ncbi:CUE domain-containing protein [Sporobolomyces salmoneus]|uniref:CUE domain-containing protein n=1 Tax=Sporobolomyces salmoneus TaxID=183962 RepID=UPI00316CFDA2